MLNKPINQKSIIPILLNHLKRYPLMTLEDIYKLCHQAAMGPGHLITDRKETYKKLCRELDQINAISTRPLLEEIDPTDRLVRLNLRSYKEKQYDPSILFELFLKTVTSFNSRIENLEYYWEEIISLSKKNMITFQVDKLNAFIKKLALKNYPAVHHSERYKKTYQPAYRLIAKQYLNRLF
jgi:hypothetical protein